MRIAVTGEGIISAIGQDKQSVLCSLRDNKTGIAPARYLSTSRKDLLIGEVKFANSHLKAALGLEEDRTLSRTILMGAYAARQALADASLPLSAIAGKRVVLVSGTTVGGMDMTEKYYVPSGPVSEDYAKCLEYHDCGGCTAAIASLCGGVFTDWTTISTACSSGANAMMLGADLLKAGLADIVVCGGSEAMSLFHLNGFASLMILDFGLCRPFDASRAGLNLGEGAAFLVMEPEASALERGAQVHAYLAGYGNACDAFHQTASSPDGEGAYLAMKEALEMAGVQPSQIDYINAHGTGTENNDYSETQALKRLFGSSVPPFSSTKGFTGHATSAAGAIEAVISLLSMQKGFIPANLGFSKVMEGGLAPSVGSPKAALNTVLCNSFGFGGNDSALVFSLLPGKEQEEFGLAEGRELSRCEITQEDDLQAVRKWVNPVESRRMGTLLKASIITSMTALGEASVQKPDAIITGTSLGCLENSIHLLDQLVLEGEESLKPSWFIQSTHNTIGSNIAIKLGCNGANITVSQRERSLEWALLYARLLLGSGRVSNVLVGCHDETTARYRQAMGASLPELHCISILLGK